MSNSLNLVKIAKTVVIEFNRPKTRNPLSIFVLDKLHKILDEVTKNTKNEVIIFTGKENVFASGADLREIAKVTKDTAHEFGLRGQSLMNKINASGKKTIAAVNGFCFGGALDLALACDKRIASPSAIFSHSGVNLGIITGWGGTQRLPRLIGEAWALEMFLTAKRVDATEALHIGLIDVISKNPLAESLANYPDDFTSISL
jgi:enoyl-CoA hydratase/carnithine racemase